MLNVFFEFCFCSASNIEKRPTPFSLFWTENYSENICARIFQFSIILLINGIVWVSSKYKKHSKLNKIGTNFSILTITSHFDRWWLRNADVNDWFPFSKEKSGKYLVETNFFWILEGFPRYVEVVRKCEGGIFICNNYCHTWVYFHLNWVYFLNDSFKLICWDSEQ